MNWAGPNFQMTARNSPCPSPNYGVGVYYNVRGSAPGALPDWDARGYAQSAAGDPGGTILLAELPNGRNVAGNDWPSFLCRSRLRLPQRAQPGLRPTQPEFILQ